MLTRFAESRDFRRTGTHPLRFEIMTSADSGVLLDRDVSEVEDGTTPLQRAALTSSSHDGLYLPNAEVYPEFKVDEDYAQSGGPAEVAGLE